ncbi:MAG: hypothetical protein KAX63_03840 [Pseudomonas sp.]|nr:hypothetical protein [Pseudomonas sp.]
MCLPAFQQFADLVAAPAKHARGSQHPGHQCTAHPGSHRIGAGQIQPKALRLPYLTLRRGILGEQSWLAWADEVEHVLQDSSEALRN